MDRVELLDLADRLLEAHRSTLLIDPFYKISLEVAAGDFHVECEADEKSSLSWIVKLNPERHQDAYDIQYSVVESLIKIMMRGLEGNDKGGIIARVTTSFCNIFSEEEVEYEDEREDED